MKRLFSAAAFLLAAAAVFARTDASGDWNYRVENGEAFVTGYNGNLVRVEIPSALDGFTVTTIADHAFYKSPLEEVSIPDSVVSIENSGFEGSSRLSAVTFSSSLKRIGSNAFAGCGSLESVNLPKSLRIISKHAFEECSKARIHVPYHTHFESMPCTNASAPIFYIYRGSAAEKLMLLDEDMDFIYEPENPEPGEAWNDYESFFEEIQSSYRPGELTDEQISRLLSHIKTVLETTEFQKTGKVERNSDGNFAWYYSDRIFAVSDAGWEIPYTIADIDPWSDGGEIPRVIVVQFGENNSVNRRMVGSCVYPYYSDDIEKYFDTSEASDFVDSDDLDNRILSVNGKEYRLLLVDIYYGVVHLNSGEKYVQPESAVTEIGTDSFRLEEMHGTKPNVASDEYKTHPVTLAELEDALKAMAERRGERSFPSIFDTDKPYMQWSTIDEYVLETWYYGVHISMKDSVRYMAQLYRTDDGRRVIDFRFTNKPAFDVFLQLSRLGQTVVNEEYIQEMQGSGNMIETPDDLDGLINDISRLVCHVATVTVDGEEYTVYCIPVHNSDWAGGGNSTEY